MKTATIDGPGQTAQAEHPGNALVTITVDNNELKIHRGSQTVAAIKTAANVPLAHDLAQNIDGKLTLLADDARVTLKGGEIFLSHPKDGTAS